MQADENGFIYPKINQDICIECGICLRVCKFRKSEMYVPQIVYVAANKEEKEIMSAASGGVFTAIAREFLKKEGIVFGSTLTFENGHAEVFHTCIDSISDLYKLQGSKYVQSEIKTTYLKAKNYLENKKKVLFSGTPCQIAGLKSFLQKSYDNLYTIDLICHGVPSNRFFNDFIQEKNKYLKGIIVDYKFRDKKYGWGMNTSLEYKSGNYLKKRYIPARLESYCTLFLDGIIYRENCYSCPFAKTERIGDITIGDYWGIETVHPELNDDFRFKRSKGISCILVNTQKGTELCESTEETLFLYKSSIEKVVVQNKQLQQSSKRPESRDVFLSAYRQGGYTEVEYLFRKKYKKQLIMHYIYNQIPPVLRIKLKKFLNKK